MARHGNVVILGRSGYAILAGLADVLHVRLQAPLEDRIELVGALTLYLDFINLFLSLLRIFGRK